MMSKRKIMLIDDSTTNNILYENILDAEGYEVIVCDDAKLGLDTLKKEAPDLIILDLMMPKMDGFDFLELMHSDVSIKNIPVIMVTAKVDKATEKKAYEMGVKSFMNKPLGIDEITTKVNEILTE
jgi:DNA-binding response OmpR family regulator